MTSCKIKQYVGFKFFLLAPILLVLVACNLENSPEFKSLQKNDKKIYEQIQKVAEDYGRLCDIRNSCLYGGASKGPQIGELNRTPHIVVATPGRLLDLLQMGKTTLRRVTYLVLDEADRMLDMGFEQDLRKILKQVRPDRQLLLWSATWPKNVQKLARKFKSNFR